MKDFELTNSDKLALETYVVVLLRHTKAVHVTSVIPHTFSQFIEFTPSVPGYTYDRYSGWFRVVG